MPQIKAVIFGSIGTLTESSEFQRRAFNAAFAEAGLEWNWSANTYAHLLRWPGGRRRIEEEAKRRSVEVDAAAIHARKGEIFRSMIRRSGVPLRAGVAECIVIARQAGIPLAFAATTERANVEAVLDAVDPPLGGMAFSFVGHRGAVASDKPAPDIYEAALAECGCAPHEAVAIEDSPENARAAIEAGLPTIGFPGAYHNGRGFEGAIATVTELDADLLGITDRRTRATG